MKASTPYPTIKGRSSTTPLAATPGDRWIVQGVLSGAWASLGFVEDQIVEADGDGSWFSYTPSSGWMAYDTETDELLQFKTGTWVVIPSIVDPGETTLKSMHIQDQKSSGTAGGSAATGTWTNSVLNTVITNTIDGASLNSNQVTLPPGRYRVTATKSFYMTHQTRTRWKTAGSDSIIRYSVVAYIGRDQGGASGTAATGGIVTFKAEFLLTETTTFVLQYRAANSGSLGVASSVASTPEIYAEVFIEDLRSIQGASGIQGPRGSVSFLDGGELTIASGVIEVTNTKHLVDTEADASSDDLDTINGGQDGMMLVLRAAHSDRTVVVKNGTGNIRLSGSDFSMDHVRDRLTLMFDSDLNEWSEIARSNNDS
jgi:hypothetical protein